MPYVLERLCRQEHALNIETQLRIKYKNDQGLVVDFPKLGLPVELPPMKRLIAPI